MATKQEVIDYIKEYIYQYSDYMGLSNGHECDKLAQMIRDLTPEVKVGKLRWREISPEHWQTVQMTALAQHYRIYYCGAEYRVYRMPGLDGVYEEYNTLSEAQDHVQNL